MSDNNATKNNRLLHKISDDINDIRGKIDKLTGQLLLIYSYIKAQQDLQKLQEEKEKEKAKKSNEGWFFTSTY